MEEKLFDVVLNLELQENKSRYNKCFITAETKSYKNPSVDLGSICSEGDKITVHQSIHEGHKHTNQDLMHGNVPPKSNKIN